MNFRDIFNRKKVAELQEKVAFLREYDDKRTAYMKKIELENAKLNDKLKKLTLTESLLGSLDEGIPIDATGRRNYMSNVAGFYASIGKKKLAHLIHQQQEQLSKFGWTEAETAFLRSNINCFRLLDEWFVKCANEHFGDLQEMRRKRDEDDVISELKTKYE